VTEPSKDTVSPAELGKLNDKAYTESFDDVISFCSRTEMTHQERYEFRKKNKPSLTRMKAD
jgi:hypothetical protein